MILVTGVAGHSGGLFASRLVREGYEGAIRCPIRPGTNLHFLEKTTLSFNAPTGDLSDPAFLDELTKDVDTLLHIGACPKFCV